MRAATVAARRRNESDLPTLFLLCGSYSPRSQETERALPLGDAKVVPSETLREQHATKRLPSPRPSPRTRGGGRAALELRYAGAAAQRGIRRAVETASGRAARRCATRRSLASGGDVLVPVLEVRLPVLRDRVSQAAADVDRAVLLRHAPRVEVLAGLLDGAAVVLDPPPAPLEPDQGLGLGARRPPEGVVLVRADRRREAVCRSEEVQRAGLPVVAGEDARLRAFLGRERAVDPRDLRDELRPAELIAEPLLERTLVRHLGLRRRGADSPLVREQLVGRQEREDGRRDARSHRDDDPRDCRLRPQP